MIIGCKQRREEPNYIQHDCLWPAIQFDTQESCCIFIIHLLDVPCIDINRFIGDKIGSKTDEREIIFLGGGKFYKNKDLTEEGFLELGNSNKFNKLMFECWYSLTNIENDKKNNINNVERALNIIDPSEYEFVKSIDDIDDLLMDIIELTPSEKDQVFKEITKNNKSGGKKSKKTKRKYKKRKYKKNKTHKKRNLKYKKK